MSFVVAAALAIGLLVVVPVLAHLLRRGRAAEQEFPPAALVPRLKPIAQQRSRLEDRALLALRGLLVVALALIGATPLVRCSRLALSRSAGASVAVALVVDDSLSMQAEVGGVKRFERARRAALDLLGSVREGDAVALVLAGRPPRLALAATTDLGAARRAVDELAVSDRATELADAIQLARSAIERLPHVDKRVVLLSDLAGTAPPPASIPVWAPVAELSAPSPDCAVVSAERLGVHVSVTVACNSAEVAQGRHVEIVAVRPDGTRLPGDGASAGAPAAPLASAALAARPGTQALDLTLSSALALADARLDGSDPLPHDDSAPVFEGSGALVVGVVADPATASVTTGGPTVIEQALAALGDGLRVVPRSLVPEDPKEYEPLAALVVDDPAGMGPEARSALRDWLQNGGVALALLGPRSQDVQLGSTLDPFVAGRARVEHTTSPGADAASVAWLGADAVSLSALGAEERVRFDDVDARADHVAGRWTDGAPLLTSREAGRGLVMVLGLCAAVDRSDLALRPGFLALLDHVLGQARRRKGTRVGAVGVPWLLPPSGTISLEGPRGTVALVAGGSAGRAAVPELLGRYSLLLDGRTEQRVALIDAAEITTAPADFAHSAGVSLGPGPAEPVDFSPQLALVVLGLFTAELALRALARLRLRRSTAGVERRAPRNPTR